MNLIEQLASKRALGGLLDALRPFDYEHLEQWPQGEFHHDHVLRIHRPPSELLGPILVVSTNCNGGVKELLCFTHPPDRWALWHARCPDNPEFSGELAPVLASARTVHWFDPCELLTHDARSELKPEFRRRQRGGGWVPLDSPEE